MPRDSLISSILRRWGYTPARRSGTAQGDGDPFAAQHRLLAGLERPTVFDVGAHTGHVTATYRRVFPGATIYAFEPWPEAYAALRARFADDADIHSVSTAVADEIGERTFFVNAYAPTNSLLPRVRSARRYYPRHAAAQGSTTVQTTTLDAFTAEHGIERIDILKLDIQGGELLALRGAGGLLRAQRIGLVYTETQFVPHYEHQPMFHEVSGYLADCGYTLFNLYDFVVATNGQLRQADALFVSEVVRAEQVDRQPDEP